MLSLITALVRILFTPCPSTSPGQTVGTVSNQDIPEASSLTASLKHQDVFWTINDSGNSPTIFGLNSAGDTLATVHLQGARNEDWEAVETAPCDDEGDATCLYIGDIGDNLKLRRNLTIYKVREPESLDGLEVLAEEVEKMTLKYPGGQAHDAESLLIDHQARTLLLITKSLTECRVFTAPLDFFPGNALHTL